MRTAYWRVIHPATGQPALIGGGVLRARFRESFRHPKLVDPGETTEYVLDLGDIGVVLPPAAVIRLEIASAAFPRYSRNLNTGGHNELEAEFLVAEQKVFHTVEYPSALILTVVDPASGDPLFRWDSQGRGGAKWSPRPPPSARQSKDLWVRSIHHDIEPQVVQALLRRGSPKTTEPSR